jgi:hypothetical protein
MQKSCLTGLDRPFYMEGKLILLRNGKTYGRQLGSRWLAELMLFVLPTAVNKLDTVIS